MIKIMQILRERDINYVHVDFDNEDELNNYISENTEKFDVVCGIVMA